MAQPSWLFGKFQLAGCVEGELPYAHTFGGPHDREGASRKEYRDLHLHLLHRLDLSDPAIPFSIPGVRWLPFYYCFDFRINVIGYRLTSDDSMVTYLPSDDPHVSKKESWPGDNYPMEFPSRRMQVRPAKYESTNLNHVYTWCGIFGIPPELARDEATAQKMLWDYAKREELVWEPEGSPFFDTFTSPFMQGRPDHPCINPQCENHRLRGTLKVIGLIPAEPVNDIHTFGPYGSEVKLIFQICPACNTIRVCNESG